MSVISTEKNYHFLFNIFKIHSNLPIHNFYNNENECSLFI